MISLGCSFTHISTFDGCPDTIKSIVSVHTFLKSLRGLPSKMEKIYCSYGYLQTLKYCPVVNYLDCSCNLLTSLEDCPKGIVELCVSNNNLTSLKGCPESIEILRCSGNQISDLIGISPNVRILECSKNELTTIEPLDKTPNLTNLFCAFNHLPSSLWMPKSVKEFDIWPQHDTFNHTLL